MNTLNSATLVNKGLELIETHLLFGIDYDRIEVVVHPQSIVHSMVTFTDGSTLAQASPPDMKLPIALALGWPARVPAAAQACDFTHRFDLGVRCRWTRRSSRPSTSPGRQASAAVASPRCTTPRTRKRRRPSSTGASRFPAIVRTIAEVLRAADQWAAEPATVDDVLDAQRWARDRAKREVEREISRKGLLTK